MDIAAPYLRTQLTDFFGVGLNLGDCREFNLGLCL